MLSISINSHQELILPVGSFLQILNCSEIRHIINHFYGGAIFWEDLHHLEASYHTLIQISIQKDLPWDSCFMRSKGRTRISGWNVSFWGEILSVLMPDGEVVIYVTEGKPNL